MLTNNKLLSVIIVLLIVIASLLAINASFYLEQRHRQSQDDAVVKKFQSGTLSERGRHVGF